MSNIILPQMMPISPRTINEIQETADVVIGEVCMVYGDGRTGGILYIETFAGVIILTRMVGAPAEEKAIVSSRLAPEKARRVIMYHRTCDHLLSSQSRDEALDQYAGAFILPGVGAMSFSGLPEIIDTPFCLSLAYHHGLIEEEYLWRLAEMLAAQGIVQGILDMMSSGD